MLAIPKEHLTSKKGTAKEYITEEVFSNLEEQWQKELVPKNSNLHGIALKKKLKKLEFKEVSQKYKNDDNIQPQIGQKQILPYLEGETLGNRCYEFLQKSVFLEQRKSSEWHHQRKIRITSTTFGDICKIKEEFYKNIVNRIIYKPIPKTTAMIHGIKYEKTALETYENISG